jgi:hypothetical protein
MGSGAEVKGSVGTRLPRRSPEAFRVAEMSQVTHIHWAALDTQTEALQETKTCGESIQLRRGGHRHRTPGDTQPERVCQSEREVEGGASRPASAAL